jgi:hypothetical protein
MLDYILERLQEDSSYAGLSGLLVMAGIHAPDGAVTTVAHTLAALAACAAFFIKQQKAAHAKAAAAAPAQVAPIQIAPVIQAPTANAASAVVPPQAR